jgi:SAM-dependent methyltransferase
MARPWNPADFNTVYERYICSDEMQFGGREYYLRYRARFRMCIRRFAELAPAHPVDILDVGGGQLALLCVKLWGDRGVAVDLPGPHLTYMANHGVETLHWNICKGDLASSAAFDLVFFAEVIEHLPLPGYIALQRLRAILRPGGTLICTTPNLNRLRNVVYMALGRRIFDNFRYPDDDVALEHVLEYSRDHLDWQFRRAGFDRYKVEYFQAHHLPTNPLHRPLAILGYPLHIVPHWHDYLIAIAHAPLEASTTSTRALP